MSDVNAKVAKVKVVCVLVVVSCMVIIFSTDNEMVKTVALWIQGIALGVQFGIGAFRENDDEEVD